MVNKALNKDITQEEKVGIVADPNKRIPKYCTNVLVSKLNNGHVILTFLQKDYTLDDAERNLEGAVLIERILLDEEHFGKVFEAMQNVVQSSTDKKDV